MGNRTERFYKIEKLIRHQSGASFEALLAALEVSPATLKRDLQFLRDRLDAPIVYSRLDNLYQFSADFRGQKHELPGLWFDEKELYSLLMAHQLLSGLDGDGMLSRHLQPLLDRIYQLLGTSDTDSAELMRRVRIISAGKRPVPSAHFELIGAALLKRQRIAMRYFTRTRKSASDRDVSPQRLIHYRNTWYLDAWCHQANELRRFALDAIESASLSGHKAKDISLKRVEQELDGGYGIFAGNKVNWATLVFSADAAQWVAREQWHPEQLARTLPDGRYELKLPYVDSTELVMDILRHGAEVEVASPKALREAVIKKLDAARAHYG
jgi:predicted DNA-binding transcriptional regulator YafY